MVAIFGGAAYLWWSGLLDRRPYKVKIFSRDAGGGYNVKLASGRFVGKGETGELEIFYGPGDKVTIQGINEGDILDNTWIYLLRTDPHTHRTLKPQINEENLILEPSMDPASRLAHIQKVKEIVERFTKQSALEKWSFPIAIFLAAAILGIAWLIGIGSTMEPLQSFAETVAKNNELMSAIVERMGEQATKSGVPPG